MFWRSARARGWRLFGGGAPAARPERGHARLGEKPVSQSVLSLTVSPQSHSVLSQGYARDLRLWERTFEFSELQLIGQFRNQLALHSIDFTVTALYTITLIDMGFRNKRWC